MAGPGNVQRQQAWAARLAKYRSSGLSVSRFCEQERVGANTFYYWAKRLRPQATPSPSRAGQALPQRQASAAPETGDDRGEATVRFHWKTGVEVSVPADCLDAIRCLAECLAKTGDCRGEAFQEVVVKV